MTTFFCKMGRRRTGIPLSARFSASTCQTDGWIGRAGQNDQVFCKWSPISPDLTVCDFFLWGYVKDRVYVPPLPANVDKLQERITSAVNSVTPGILHRVWSELDCRIDVCRVTKGGNIECVCDTTWHCMCLCNCSHQFCKNIPVSFDVITTWNQGVFLWSLCILYIYIRGFFKKRPNFCYKNFIAHFTTF